MQALIAVDNPQTKPLLLFFFSLLNGNWKRIISWFWLDSKNGNNKLAKLFSKPNMQQLKKDSENKYLPL